MSTHRTFCVVCGTVVYCSGDNHALGCGGDHGEGGCDNPPYVEFCSLEHAMELQRRLNEAIENFRDVHGACNRADCYDCLHQGRKPPYAYPTRSVMEQDDLSDAEYLFQRKGGEAPQRESSDD